MSTLPASAAPAAPVPKAESTTMKVEDQGPGTQEAPQAANGDVPLVNWESEIQLVSSLAKLQALERKVSVQRLRTILSRSLVISGRLAK